MFFGWLVHQCSVQISLVFGLPQDFAGPGHPSAGGHPVDHDLGALRELLDLAGSGRVHPQGQGGGGGGWVGRGKDGGEGWLRGSWVWFFRGVGAGGVVPCVFVWRSWRLFQELVVLRKSGSAAFVPRASQFPRGIVSRCWLLSAVPGGGSAGDG